MSGWDEGPIYYSDQAAVLGDGGADNPNSAAVTASRDSVRSLFKEFVRGFKPDSVFRYRESLLQNPKFLLIDMEDLDAFNSDLTALLRSSPADYLPLVSI